MAHILTAFQQLLESCKTTLLKEPVVSPQPTNSLIEAMKMQHQVTKKEPALSLSLQLATLQVRQQRTERQPTGKFTPAHPDRMYTFAEPIPVLLMIADAVHQSMREVGAIPIHARVSEQNFGEFCSTSGPSYSKFYRNVKMLSRDYYVTSPSTGMIYSVKVWPDPTLSNTSIFCDWREGTRWQR